MDSAHFSERVSEKLFFLFLFYFLPFINIFQYNMARSQGKEAQGTQEGLYKGLQRYSRIKKNESANRIIMI